MREITHLVIHHSASPLNVTAETIREWHMAKGWADIGYHVVIERHGNIVSGRSLDIPGAHVKGHNYGTLGICLVGNNTLREHEWQSVQTESLRTLLDIFAISYPEAIILGHRDLPNTATECPGLDIRELLGLPSLL